jgi:hypothetical protein
MQNKYDDGKSNFLGPKVTQYDGHMIMSNVVKPTKNKFINIDTAFRDEYSDVDVSSDSSCEVTLPNRITNVKSVIVRSIEVPMTIYNFSSAIGNNYFKMISETGSSIIITIPDGDYTPKLLLETINVVIQSKPSPFNKVQYITNIDTNSTSSFVSTDGSFNIVFAVDKNGQFDGSNFKRKFGWFLGFRKVSYNITNVQTISEGFIDFLGIKYLYLVLDEYTRGNQNSFIAALPSSLINKSIIARIALNKTMFPFGSFLPANNFNGYLLSDKRTYSGKVDLFKLSIKLVDDIGNVVSLNGLDYSFCLEVEHE